ncbi:hypothetical protein V6170_12500, partial [Klebsiella pneumoniae]
TVCVVGKMRDLILQLSKSSIYSTKPIWLSFSHPQCKKTLTGLSFPPQTLALRLILPVNIRYQELSYHSISHSQK